MSPERSVTHVSERTVCRPSGAQIEGPPRARTCTATSPCFAYNEFVLAQSLEFAPERDVEAFASVPAAPAVFLLRGEDVHAGPYVSKTANLRRRLQRLLGRIEERTRKLNLRDRVRHIDYTPTGSDFESGFVLYEILRASFPNSYANRMRFRFAPLVKLHLENEYPRASITTRPGRLSGRSLYYGPFASRAAAEKFMNDSLDFFKMRRCAPDLHPDSEFPGCIYSEMKMCLAPCFKGCTDEEHSAEVARVQAYFDSAGESLAREFSAQRDAASTNLGFEDAAAIHARLEKLKPVLSQLPEAVHRLDRLSALMIQPCHISDSVAFFRIEAGCISGPVVFCIQATEHAKSQSMESRVQEALGLFVPPKTKSVLETMEHLALFKRWYYRGSRMGEVFFADDAGKLPLRRVVRGISRVYRGEKPEGNSTAPRYGSVSQSSP
jgi:excinuclease ABC subunit C